MNRVEIHAEKLRERFKIGDVLKPEECFPGGALEKGSALDSEEHAWYQGVQSRARASEILSLEEALTIYSALGEVWTPENGGWAPHVDLALKVSITQVVSEFATAEKKETPRQDYLNFEEMLDDGWEVD